jgi:hypothetical protein
MCVDTDVSEELVASNVHGEGGLTRSKSRLVLTLIVPDVLIGDYKS